MTTNEPLTCWLIRGERPCHLLMSLAQARKIAAGRPLEVCTSSNPVWARAILKEEDDDPH